MELVELVVLVAEELVMVVQPRICRLR